MIVKPARTGYVDLGNEQLSIYTSQVLAEHLDHLCEARLSPAIYQELIEKRSDVRVTYVGGRLFVAEIDSQTDDAAKLDWRRTQNPNLPHRRAELPANVCENLLQLLVRLRLEYGAIDLIRTLDDEYVFLEINPNGQWQWLDDMLEMGITDSIVGWLLGRRD
jgi:glutathione synthase/RimK-type ligase-like ATP-grasp enzyme